jgi:DNA-binding YbaB/EbfC family protein
MRNLASMMQKAKEVQQLIAQMKEELAEMRFHGEAGGGAVTVETDGRGIVHDVKLSPDIIGLETPEDVAMLEDLIQLAVNDAKAAADKAREEKLKALTGGLPLPPGLDLPF